MGDLSFDKLVDGALEAHFQGWDFSWLADRWYSEALLWDYDAYVRSSIRSADSLLDLGTGGGEVLASFIPLPARTVATEGYLPNVEVARERLGSLGVEVVDTSDDPSHTHLRFPDQSFDLITDRHTGARAAELWRCLKPSGSYITQQVGSQDCIALNEWLGDTSRGNSPRFDLEALTEQLVRAGFAVVEAQEAYPKVVYRDIGAIVYHLKAIPWMVPGFDVDTHRERLLSMHKHICENGGLTVPRHRFFIHAKKLG